MDVYPFNRRFRLKLIALCLDPLWRARVGDLIVPDYFIANDERGVVTAIRLYAESYGKIPKDPDDVIELCEDDDAKALVDAVYDEKDDYDLDMVKDVAIQWAKEQAAKIAILDSVDDVKRGDLQSVITRMGDALKVGEDIQSPGIDPIRDVNLWLYSQWVDKIRTGWVHVDNHMDGGLGIGELGVVLAPTNRGKSVAMVNIAYGAAGIGSGKNVVLFTHEMKPKIYAKRFGARTIFRFPSKHGDLQEYEKEFLEAARKLITGKVRIIGGASRMTTMQLDDSVKRLKDEGFIPDLMIDDYADMISPPRKYTQRRFEHTAVYEWLREFGDANNFPVWTASQVGRAAYSKEVITEADVAEDIGKVNTADVVVAICQTREEEKKDRCRLYFPKIRDGKRAVMFDAKYYPDAQALITIGMTKEREMENA